MAEIFEKNEKNDEKPQFQNNPKKYPRIRKNEKFKNRASSCSNQAQMTSWAEISWQTDRHTYIHTDKIHVS